MTSCRRGAGISWALLAQLAAGCGDTEAPTPSAADQARDEVARMLARPTKAQRARDPGDQADGTLSIAVRRAPTDLDPTDPLDPWAARVVDDLVFQGLTRRDPEQAPFAKPNLADHCTVVPAEAPQHVWCRLRDDARFHDGEPVTGDDVVYSIGYWLDSRRGSLRLRHGLTDLDEVELATPPPEVLATAPAATASDPVWVHLVSERPDPLLLERIGVMKVVPRARHQGHATSFGRSPIGSGPMRVVAMEPERVVLERTESSESPEGGGTPEGSRQVSRLVLQTVSDGAEALTLLRRGEVQIVAEVAAVHVPDELAKPGMAARFTAWHLTPPWFDMLVYNLRGGPLAGPRLRAALDDALSRAQLSTLYPMPGRPALAPVDLHEPVPVDLAALEGFGVSADWGMAGLPAPVEPDPEAVAQAGRTLDELGWPLDRGLRRRDSGHLRLVLMWNGAMGRGSDIARTVRDAWRDLGVTVPYATASWGYIFGLMRRADFEVALVRMAGSSDVDLYPYFHSRGEQNLSGVADAELDRALEDYRAAVDLEQRRRAKQAVAARLAELQPVSVLHAPTAVMLVSRQVEGLQFVDDLPRLDLLRLGAPMKWVAGTG